jgi:hypothetical protein
MPQIEKVQPTTIDNIEFYCSINGEDTGMSHTGLFKFTGIARTTGRRLIGVLNDCGQHVFTGSLERWNTVSIFHENLLGVNDGKGGQILKAEFCADFCTFAAYEHNGGNKIARYSLSKFATSGIKTFIQEATGFKTVKPSSEMSTILAVLQRMDNQLSQNTKDLHEVRIELAKTAGYRTAKVFYPGLGFIPEDPIEDDTLCLPGEDTSWYTVPEAMAELFPNMTFTNGNKISIGMMVSGSWKTLKQELPTKVVRLNKAGYKAPPIAAYPASFLPVIKNDIIKFIVSL